MKIRKAIIAAAGFGSRFLPITKTIPKELMPIIDKPIIHHLVEECAAADIEEVIIVANPSEISKFEDYFYGRATNIRTLMIRQNKLERWSRVEKIFKLPEITIIPQDERIPYGNGRPILSARTFVENEEGFAAMWGDDMVISDIPALLQIKVFFEDNRCDSVFAVQKMTLEQICRTATFSTKAGNHCQVERIIEKPEPSQVKHKLGEYGRFAFTPRIFEYLTPESIGKDGEIWLIDAIDKLARSGKVLYKEVEGKWTTTGDPINYIKTQVQFALKDKNISRDLKQFLKEIL